MKTFQTDLPKMFGDHHVLEVRKILLILPGIEDLYASSSFQTIQISYDDEKLKEEEILNALKAAGYLGEMPTPQESNMAATENRNKNDFRHTAAFEHTKQISFHRESTVTGKALWPCPGIGVVNVEKLEE